MSELLKCDRCGEGIRGPFATILSPQDHEGKVKRLEICSKCWRHFENFMAGTQRAISFKNWLQRICSDPKMRFTVNYEKKGRKKKPVTRIDAPIPQTGIFRETEENV